MAHEHVGVVIRAQAVEVAVVQQSLLGEATLMRHARVPFTPSEQPYEHDAAVTQAMREAMAACQVPSNAKVAVAVPAKEVLLRCFTLPLLPKAEWEQAVQFEARKYIPVKIDQLIWNYYPAPMSKTKQLEIVFAGIRHETFARMQGWLSGAGIKAGLIESVSGSLARAVGKRAGEAFVAVVDVEPEMAHLAIIKDGVPYLSREVSFTAPASQESSIPAPNHRLEMLASELRVSLEFFAREHAGAMVTRVLMFGDDPVVTEWAPQLAEHVG